MPQPWHHAPSNIQSGLAIRGIPLALLLQCDDDKLDFSGDIGAVGRAKVRLQYLTTPYATAVGYSTAQCMREPAQTCTGRARVSVSHASCVSGGQGVGAVIPRLARLHVRSSPAVPCRAPWEYPAVPCRAPWEYPLSSLPLRPAECRLKLFRCTHVLQSVLLARFTVRGMEIRITHCAMHAEYSHLHRYSGEIVPCSTLCVVSAGPVRMLALSALMSSANTQLHSDSCGMSGPVPRPCRACECSSHLQDPSLTFLYDSPDDFTVLGVVAFAERV